MPASKRRSDQPSTISPETILGGVLLGAVVLLVGGAWLALQLANLVATTPQDLPRNPFSIALGPAGP